MLNAALAEKLPNHFLDRHFLNVDVADITGLQEFATGLGHFRARHLQLDRHRRLLDHFAEPGKIPRDLLVESEAENFVTGEAVNDFVERTVEENFAMINDQDAMTKFLDVETRGRVFG